MIGLQAREGQVVGTVDLAGQCHGVLRMTESAPSATDVDLHQDIDVGVVRDGGCGKIGEIR